MVRLQAQRQSVSAALQAELNQDSQFPAVADRIHHVTTRHPSAEPTAPHLRPAGHRFGYGAASVVPYLLEGRLRSGTLLFAAVDGQNALADERLRPRRRRR